MQDFVQDSKFIKDEVATFKYIFEGSTQDTTIDKNTIQEIEKLINERNQARIDGDYVLADKIRDKLSKMNVSVKDVDGKSDWKI